MNTTRGLVCCFCAAPEKNVKHLFVSNDGKAHICNECAKLCVPIIEEAIAEDAKKAAEAAKAAKQQHVPRKVIPLSDYR